MAYYHQHKADQKHQSLREHTHKILAQLEAKDRRREVVDEEGKYTKIAVKVGNILVALFAIAMVCWYVSLVVTFFSIRNDRLQLISITQPLKLTATEIAEHRDAKAYFSENEDGKKLDAFFDKLRKQRRYGRITVINPSRYRNLNIIYENGRKIQILIPGE